MSVTIAIRKDVEVSDEFLACIITTAVEGGIGYWSQVSDYNWTDPQLDKEPTSHFAEARVHEMADADETEYEVYGDDWSGWYRKEGVWVRMEDIARALAKIAGPDEIEHCGQTWRERMVSAMIEEDAGDIDSSDADNIVQVAMFGKLVYG